MQFLQGFVLYGLIALAIPVIIHLFNFRRARRVWFTNVRFLKVLKLESKKHSRLKQRLILLSRLLAFAALIFAFARPIIPAKNDYAVKKRKTLAVVWIDNSYSMQTEGSDGVLIDMAVKKASEIAMVYAPADEFFLLTNDFKSTYQRIVNRSDFLEMVTTVEVSPAVRNVKEINARIEDMARNNPNMQIERYYISDFQRSTVKIADYVDDTTGYSWFLPLSPKRTNNIFIDSCFIASPVIRPGQLVTFITRIHNSGTEPVEDFPVSLEMNGKQAAIASINLPANGNAEAHLTFRIEKEGLHFGIISFADDPVIFDDRFHIAFDVQKTKRVEVFNQSVNNRFITTLFQVDTAFEFLNTAVQRIDYAGISRNDFLVCNELTDISSALKEALTDFVGNGGSLLLLPPADGDVAGCNDLLKGYGAGTFSTIDTADTRLTDIDFQHTLLREVYSEIPENLIRPLVKTHYTISSAPGDHVVFGLRNGNPLLFSRKFGEGNLYVFATPFHQDFIDIKAAAEIVVPPLINMALFSGKIPTIAYTLGRDKSIAIRNNHDISGDGIYKFIAVDGDYSFIPAHRNTPYGTELFIGDQVKEAMRFRVMAENKEIDAVAFNYRSYESILNYYDAVQIDSMVRVDGWKNTAVLNTAVKDAGEVLSSQKEGVKLWRWFVLLALIFLLIEVLLIRFWNVIFKQK